jgi:phytoene synthase
MEYTKTRHTVQEGFEKARTITGEHARSFYFALRFLKRKPRYAVFSVYAICRMIDDAVDESEENLKEERLRAVHENISKAYSQRRLSSPLLGAFQETVAKYRIPKDYFEELVKGMYMDIRKNRYRNFDELFVYCYRVAGVIGLIMLRILGYKDEQAKLHAIELGVAMQLTNILRDVQEDYERGRIYLPQDEMQRFGITEAYIKEAREDSNYKEFLRFQVQRARSYYADAARVIKLMKDGNGRFVVQLMKELYAAILDVIERKNYDVTERASITTSKKLCLFFKVATTCPYVWPVVRP